ncbi:NrdH-redoxin [Rubrobacter tropicus]|uniref:NrdH-redoxin n=1 Tax=Rubrobacter tropicus TaxID=2653851 RepID=A0A6G8QDH6_9ACTN|nr:glutaredoxin family protein [Rubrobacter tropicus]QIN84488.1 NrdH-redoxin [Rubrobacter tropicus]
MAEVLVFTTSTCPWCRRAKEYLANKNLSFREVNVERDAAAAEEMVEATGQSAVPALKIGDTWVVGFHPPTIDRAFARAGLPSVG